MPAIREVTAHERHAAASIQKHMLSPAEHGPLLLVLSDVCSCAHAVPVPSAYAASTFAVCTSTLLLT